WCGDGRGSVGGVAEAGIHPRYAHAFSLGDRARRGAAVDGLRRAAKVGRGSGAQACRGRRARRAAPEEAAGGGAPIAARDALRAAIDALSDSTMRWPTRLSRSRGCVVSMLTAFVPSTATSGSGCPRNG